MGCQDGVRLKQIKLGKSTEFKVQCQPVAEISSESFQLSRKKVSVEVMNIYREKYCMFFAAGKPIRMENHTLRVCSDPNNAIRFSKFSPVVALESGGAAPPANTALLW